MDPIDREKLLSIIAEHERDSTAPIDYVGIIKSMPSAQPEPLSNAYMKAVWT